jgi:hypothetical protein
MGRPAPGWNLWPKRRHRPFALPRPTSLVWLGRCADHRKPAAVKEAERAVPDDEMYDLSSDLDENELDENDLEDDGVLDASDTLDGEIGEDPLDAGFIPPDRWSAGEGFGTTLAEERAGESLDQLLAEEEPEPDPYADADLPEDGSASEQPEPRSGRLVADDEGAHPDAEADLVAHDVGIDGGAATAEEAAVHIQDEDDIT